MGDHWLGVACSVLRVTGVASVVLTAFIRLPAQDFIAFSQFHVGLSIASFVECLAVVERSRLYTSGADGARERAALLLWARRIGIGCLVAGVAAGPFWTGLSAVSIGAGIAALALPESAVLREQPRRAARIEFTALTIAIGAVAASWLLPTFAPGMSLGLIALLAAAPRLTLSAIWRMAAVPMPWLGAWQALRRNMRSIAPFIANQAALPWLFAAPNYVVPAIMPARDSSWILLGLRASGSVASMLTRTFVQRWISIADGHDIQPVPRTALLAFSGLFIIVVTAAFSGLPELPIVIIFTAYLALACAFQAMLSTQLNAAGRYLVQLPAYASFWLTGAAGLLMVAAIGRTPSLALYCSLHAAGALGSIAVMFRLSAQPIVQTSGSDNTT